MTDKHAADESGLFLGENRALKILGLDHLDALSLKFHLPTDECNAYQAAATVRFALDRDLIDRLFSLPPDKIET